MTARVSRSFRSVWRAGMAAGALGLAAAAAPLSGALLGDGAAQAQSGGRTWVNPDVIALREEVERLGREVARLRGGAAPAPSGDGLAPVGADAYVRLDAIETQLRRLIGRIEQVEFQQRSAQAEQARRMEDFALRLQLIEQALGTGGGGADLSDPNAIGLGDPSLEGDGALGGGVGGAGLDGGGLDGGVVAGAPAPETGGFDSGYASGAESAGGGLGGIGAPPRPLGTLPGGSRASGGGGASGGVPAGGFPASGGFSGAAVPAPVEPGRAGPSDAARAAIDPAADDAMRSAIMSLNTGSFDEAERQLTSFLSRFPGHPREGEALFWLGETNFVRSRFVEAAQAFQRSATQFPSGPKAPDSLLRLGMSLAQLNQRAEACLTLSSIATRYPSASPTTLNRAQVESRRNGCR